MYVCIYIIDTCIYVYLAFFTQKDTLLQKCGFKTAVILHSLNFSA